MDWGIFQVETILEREEIHGKILLTLTHFGDHTLHHLFPTLDHSFLPYLHDILLQTCKEFKYEFKTCSWWGLTVGQFKQLVRTETNAVPVMLRKKKM